jgi:hypothetical protein
MSERFSEPMSSEPIEAARADRVQRLRCQKLAAIERTVADQRRSWAPAGAPDITNRPRTPRAAYELFLLEYLGLEFRGRAGGP